MANSLCKSTTPNVYQEIINNVIHNVHDIFIEDGVDESVLQQLKVLWEKKLSATNAVPGFNADHNVATDSNIANCSKNQPLQECNPNQLTPKLKKGTINPDIAGTSVMELSATYSSLQDSELSDWRKTPVQFTIPPMIGEPMKLERILTVDVPAIFMQDNHLINYIITGDTISATLNMSLESAQAYLQEQINTAMLKHQQNNEYVNLDDGIAFGRPLLQHTTTLAADQSGRSEFSVEEPIQTQTINDESSQEQKVYFELKPASFSIGRSCSTPQVDGSQGSSEDDVDGNDRNNHNANSMLTGNGEHNANDREHAEHDNDEESLNSEDDISDPDGLQSSFDCENLIVCQFDKIARARNRWKFDFKNGIMHLNGHDYVFQKANGDAEW